MLAWERDDAAGCLALNERAHRLLAQSGVQLPSFRVFSALGRSARVRLGAPAEPDDALLEPFDEPPLFRALMQTMRALDLVTLGECREGLALIRSVLAAEIARHPSVAGNGTFTECLARRYLEPPRAVLPRVDELAAEMRRRGLPLAHLRCEALACQLLVDAGEHEAALRRGRAALGGAQGSPGTIGWIERLVELAGAALGRSQPIPRTSAATIDDADGARNELLFVEALLASGQAAAARSIARDLEAVCARSHWGWMRCRTRLLHAEAALACGDFAEAAAVLADAHADATACGYVNETVLAELLELALQRAAGGGDAAEHLAAVAAQAPGVLLRRLSLDATPTVRITRSDGTGWLTPAQLVQLDLGCPPPRLVVDLVRDRIVIDGRVEDLSRRETLLPLVRALVMAPGMRLTASELVRRAWGFEYHALNHRGRLSMAISRLRRLLGDELFESARDGYGLRVPGAWVLIESIARAEITVAQGRH